MSTQKARFPLPRSIRSGEASWQVGISPQTTSQILPNPQRISYKPFGALP